ncbi:T9SS type A sorting domain-containing protein [Prolixibacteraceae bacterium JC049]|nr:T9SS type A sorting domain-containing protein [Prolixibacteraceae bacterium JC049]
MNKSYILLILLSFLFSSLISAQNQVVNYKNSNNFNTKAAQIDTNKKRQLSNSKIAENNIIADSINVKLKPAQSISYNRALLSGTIALNAGTIDSIAFQYSQDSSFSYQYIIKNAVAKNSSSVVSALINKLESNTKYNYRLSVFHNGKQILSSIKNFKTLSNYDLGSGGADALSNSAYFYGKITPRDTTITDIRFEYSTAFEYNTTKSFKNSVEASPNKVTPDSTYYVNAQVDSLIPETEYFVRLRAKYKNQTIYRYYPYFKTKPEYTIWFIPRHIHDNSIEFVGSVVAYKDDITDLTLQYGKTIDYSKSVKITPNKRLKGEHSNLTIRCEINELDSSSIYFYRHRFIMGADTIYGKDQIISLDLKINMSLIRVQQISNNSVLVEGLINPNSGYLQNIHFKYGKDGNLSDSIYSTPGQVNTNKTYLLQAKIDSLTPNVKYSIQLSGTGSYSKTYKSNTLEFIVTDKTGVKIRNKSRDIKIYPNPCSKIFSILSDTPVILVELFNTDGNRIKTTHNTQLDISELPTGVYFVKIQTEANTLIRKILKI